MSSPFGQLYSVGNTGKAFTSREAAQAYASSIQRGGLWPSTPTPTTPTSTGATPWTSWPRRAGLSRGFTASEDLAVGPSLLRNIVKMACGCRCSTADWQQSAGARYDLRVSGIS